MFDQYIKHEKIYFRIFHNFHTLNTEWSKTFKLIDSNVTFWSKFSFMFKVLK